MNTAHFSSVSKKILFVGREESSLQLMNLKELIRALSGITAVDRLYPLKPKNPI